MEYEVLVQRISTQLLIIDGPSREAVRHAVESTTDDPTQCRVILCKDEHNISRRVFGIREIE